jgi:hypothetical protein
MAKVSKSDRRNMALVEVHWQEKAKHRIGKKQNKLRNVMGLPVVCRQVCRLKAWARTKTKQNPVRGECG